MARLFQGYLRLGMDEFGTGAVAGERKRANLVLRVTRKGNFVLLQLFYFGCDFLKALERRLGYLLYFGNPLFEILPYGAHRHFLPTLCRPLFFF